MTDTNFPLSADTDLDDLPRTLRREHEARAREREARRRGGLSEQAAEREEFSQATLAADAPAATVTRIDVPFMRLVAFYLRSVLAAIPALILLTIILWFAGQGLRTFYPELVKMKILITFPNG